MGRSPFVGCAAMNARASGIVTTAAITTAIAIGPSIRRIGRLQNINSATAMTAAYTRKNTAQYIDE